MTDIGTSPDAILNKGRPAPKPIYGYAIVYTSRLGNAHFFGGYFRTRKEARDWWLSIWMDKASAAREWRRDTRSGSIRIAKVEMMERDATAMSIRRFGKGDPGYER